MPKCPECLSEGAYIGINEVECSNPNCRHYKAPTEEIGQLVFHGGHWYEVEDSTLEEQLDIDHDFVYTASTYTRFSTNGPIYQIGITCNKKNEQIKLWNPKVLTANGYEEIDYSTTFKQEAERAKCNPEDIKILPVIRYLLSLIEEIEEIKEQVDRNNND